ncbi:M15 family metallopeptidase [Bacillus pseudomycoides]|uniref:M15 family metallopeptidase n=1 Tax=Bacillus pseudomycoides TaxID=64104 RepID=UPI002FFF2FD4
MKYHTRNVNNLNKLGDHTKAEAFKWYQYCVDNGIEILIYETIRTIEKQRENVRKGASQTMRSYHLVGQALDFVPITSNGSEDWEGYWSEPWSSAIRYAKKVGFEWGGDWKGFVDSPHLQYNYNGYGTDTFNGGDIDVSEPNYSNERDTPDERGAVDLPGDWQTNNLGYVTVTVDVANVREQPSTDSSIKGKVSRGSGHVYLDWHHDGSHFWRKIANDNWLRDDVCVINKDGKSKGVVWVSGTNINLRKGASTGDAVMNKLTKQSAYDVHYRYENWIYVTGEGVEGWMYFDESYVSWLR